MVRPYVIQALVLYDVWRSHTDEVKGTSLLGYDAVCDSSEEFTVLVFKVVCTTSIMGAARSSETSATTNPQDVMFTKVSIYLYIAK
jgi:hypothetical protein